MPGDNDLPLNNPSDADIKPWEQRSAPGMGGGGGTDSLADPTLEPPAPERLCQAMENHEVPELVDRQTDLAYLPMVDLHKTAGGDSAQTASSNREVWQLFLVEKLYDTRRVRLEQFHLFEWFPAAPGRFHTRAAQQQRFEAAHMMVRTPEGFNYYDPYGKASMIRGGVGTVRLRPRLIAGEPHYFMTASSNEVCHEGFPVLVPRRFYGPLKARLLSDGAVPVTLSGEMRYLQQAEMPAFFNTNREIPQLYLHVDDVETLAAPRTGIKQFSVSAAVSFFSDFEKHGGIYATFATFDPAKPDSLQHAVDWLEQFYVGDKYKGSIITDFDEAQARFPEAVFGLPDLMAGKMDPNKISAFLQEHGFSAQAGEKFFLVYKEINTHGGDYIDAKIDIGGDVKDSTIIVGKNNTVTKPTPPNS